MKVIPIPELLSRYAVDEHGNVFTLINTRGRNIPARSKATYIRNGGYVYTQFRIGSKNKKFTVHGLVMLTFLGQRNGLQINHIDGCKTNNCLSNLEYVTAKQNIQHAISTGLRKKFPSIDRSKYKHLNRFSDDEILEIRRICEEARSGSSRFPHKSLQKIAAKFNTHKSNIRKIFLREKYRYLP